MTMFNMRMIIIPNRKSKSEEDDGKNEGSSITIDD